MYPELFELPLVHVTVKTYGLIMVIGFLVAVSLMRRLVCRLGENPDHITNTALYALLAGIVGARIFYVVHHFEDFRHDSFLRYFATWEGGLELVGGVILAVIVIMVYLYLQQLSIGRYMDILAIGLMLGLAFGRVGCYFSGCCWGRPTKVPWAIRFPYGSDAYRSQVNADYTRDRGKPRLELPEDYFAYDQGESKRFSRILKPLEDLTEEQKFEVTKGSYRCIPVHPSQFYSSANALAVCALLYLFWRKTGYRRPGTTVSLMFILYGLTRFGLEFLRDDNPFETGWWTVYDGWTVSQNLGMYMAVAGLVLMVTFLRKPVKPVPASMDSSEKNKNRFRDRSGRFVSKRSLPKEDKPEDKTRDSRGRFIKKESKSEHQKKSTGKPKKRTPAKKTSSKKKAAKRKSAKKKTPNKKKTKRK